MKREEVLAIVAQHQQELKAMGVKSLALFGSVARDEATAESDIVPERAISKTRRGYLPQKTPEMTVLVSRTIRIVRLYLSCSFVFPSDIPLFPPEFHLRKWEPPR
jgi:predicted nucleotidyltransferase